MRTVSAAAMAFSAPVGQVASTDPVLRWRPYIAEASARFGVPQRWIERVMRAESRGMTALNGRSIRSRAGAIGLMQLMPTTWATMRAWLRLGGDPDDPHDNIIAGTAYLRLLYDRFGYPGLFAAYNAGPTRYTAFLRGGRPLPGETVAYLGQVAEAQGVRASANLGPKTGDIFVQIAGENSAVITGDPASSALSVPLKMTEPTR